MRGQPIKTFRKRQPINQLQIRQNRGHKLEAKKRRSGRAFLPMLISPKKEIENPREIKAVVTSYGLQQQIFRKERPQKRPPFGQQQLLDLPLDLGRRAVESSLESCRMSSAERVTFRAGKINFLIPSSPSSPSLMCC